MTGIFRTNNPYNNFLLLVYALVLRFPSFLRPDDPVTGSADGFLYTELIAVIKLLNTRHLFAILSLILVFSQSLLLNNLTNRFRLMQRPNYLTGMSYLLIGSMFSEWFSFSSAMIAVSFFIWILYLLSDININPNPKSTIFNIGLLLSVTSFFYLPAIFFLILIFAGIAISRPFRLPEWIVALLALITPYYFLISILFLKDQLELPASINQALEAPVVEHWPWALSAMILIGIASMTGVYFVRQNMLRQIVQTRKNWSLIFLFAVLSVCIPFVNGNKAFTYWFMMAAPSSVLVAAAFLYPDRKWFRQVMHWSMWIIAMVVGYYFR